MIAPHQIIDLLVRNDARSEMCRRWWDCRMPWVPRALAGGAARVVCGMPHKMPWGNDRDQTLLRSIRRQLNRTEEIQCPVRPLALRRSRPNHGTMSRHSISLLSGQELNKFNWLSAMTYSEPSVSWKTTDSIEAFSNTVTENTCINV
jgi:hypothetical protein